ncbi:SMP-30/gluconolactonase/LRE family protein [Paraliomyxa miuraensis]|uniref:SMP-30/gluconolactonase/LRE family protein n=1 Tax=Paraliomyxa miuraensis TaxID=376150 RepID=UPI00224D415E|nr:SMP-30/gluconolactonase/LRE family protein [Paraliomyxa miuraensis]MCX4246844.1 SMP-30/gluconolactonase/LRE family protein [Paraliomyxa miuraensis]
MSNGMHDLALGAARIGTLVGSTLVLCACPGDDGSASSTTTVTSATADPTVDPTVGGSATGTSTSVGPGTTDDGPTPTTDDGADSTGTTGDPPPPASICPDGPFPASPLPGAMVAAQPVPNTQLGLYPGGLVEGPVWIGDALHLSHFGTGPEPPASILRYVPGGALEEHIAGSGSNGLAVDSRGRIVAATHDDGGISTFTLDGTRASIVAQYQGNRLNSPNDLTLRDDGTIYFTDPSWQAQNPNPQPVRGIYRVDPGGAITLEDGTQNMPNGITLSPDQAWLYVGTPGGVLRYDVEPGGALVTPPTPFAPGLGLSSVDGMGMDCAGNLYVTLHSAGQVRVLGPDQTDHGTIMVASSLTNVAFGGADRRTLYATAGDPSNGNAIYSIELEIPGYPY